MLARCQHAPGVVPVRRFGGVHPPPPCKSLGLQHGNRRPYLFSADAETEGKKPMPRKPKPHALKVVSGTTRGKATEATQARLSGTTPPAFLSDRAAQHWPDLADLLAGMGVLKDGDLIALGLLCETLAEYLDARDTVARDGATYEAVTEAGATMHRAHPAVAQRADAARRVQSLLSEFGLTPSARAKVQGLPDLPGDDPAKAYFS